MLDYERLLNIRGLILSFLRSDPNMELADRALLQAMSGYGYDDLTLTFLKREIQYLDGKEFVEQRKKNHEITMVTLTAKGIDLLEGRIDDDGINVLKI